MGNCRLALVDFSHANILKYCNRPFSSPQEMDSILIKNWNSVVGVGDVVYVLGDFTMRGKDDKPWFEKTLSKLNGSKCLILGNHDKLHGLTYVDLGFQSVHTSLFVDGVFLAHDPALATVLPEGTHMMCGHVHNLFKLVARTHRVLNVGVDVWDYKPVSFGVAFSHLTCGTPDSQVDVTSPTFERHGDRSA